MREGGGGGEREGVRECEGEGGEREQERDGGGEREEKGGRRKLIAV